MPGTSPLRRAPRRGAPPSLLVAVAVAVAELDLPGNAGATYVAGEVRACQLVRLPDARA
ncbi:hypothetical protein GCM10009850_072280 [Nonomuraea monospora]|uniref:Uncharacterized protein n=1 Tax=Nonomuraea monospora TaxID=568818 RepID=A0ABP5PJ83_9ACTN